MSSAHSGISLPARLEAILYLKGRPLTLGELAEIAGVEREEAELALITLMADYAHRDTALEIRQEGHRYSLQLGEAMGIWCRTCCRWISPPPPCAPWPRSR